MRQRTGRAASSCPPSTSAQASRAVQGDLGVSSVEDTPIFDELRRRSHIRSAHHDTAERIDKDDDPTVKPVVDRNPPPRGSPPAMIIVAGGRGVGKTAFVGSVSEVALLNTEVWRTKAECVDPVEPQLRKTTADVVDFGRITLQPDLVLYLFSTVEQPRYHFGGALGAVVLVNSRQIQESFAAISYFEKNSDLPFIVAINMFDGQLPHDLDEVREALALAPDVPLTTCDARDPESTAKTLQELVYYMMKLSNSRDRQRPENCDRR